MRDWTVDDQIAVMRSAEEILLLFAKVVDDTVVNALSGITGEENAGVIKLNDIALIIKKHMDARPLEQHKHQS